MSLAMSSAPVLDLQQVVMSFGSHRVLDNADLTIASGEVHALLGENGSGKSTLIKILSGTYVPEAGHLFVRGCGVPLPLEPGRSRSLGMEFVHQDLGLIPSLSVAENMLLSELARRVTGGWYLPRSRLVARTRSILEQYDVAISPEAEVRSITPVERALLAIVRAFHGLAEKSAGPGVSVLVLDEPTVFLPRRDVDRLFELIRRITREGASVLFVSHDIDEVLEITDTVTVLRDGRVAGVRKTAEVTKAALVELIIGRALGASLPHGPSETGRVEPLIRVEAASGRVVADASFELRQGEVLGLTGLVGSGFDELPYLLYGARTAGNGSMTMKRETMPLAGLTPRSALKLGLVLIPADRREDGSAPSLTVTDNVTMPTLRRFQRKGFLGRRRMTAQTRALMDRFDVRPREPSQAYRLLSGGNQQKALLAKWLQLNPLVLLLHEPTQGVDIGAREQVFAMIREAMRAGAAVLCASSDYEQLSIICDRVLIFSAGRIVAELAGDAASKESITRACFQSFAPPVRASEAHLSEDIRGSGDLAQRGGRSRRRVKP